MPKSIVHKPKAKLAFVPKHHDMPAYIKDEERRVQTTCFRCHGPKPAGGSWYCPKCEKIVRAAIQVQAARFAGGHY